MRATILPYAIMGPLTGGPQCRLSILRNGNVPCRLFLNVPVDFKVPQCRLSILRNGPVALSNLGVKGPYHTEIFFYFLSTACFCCCVFFFFFSLLSISYFYGEKNEI